MLSWWSRIKPVISVPVFQKAGISSREETQILVTMGSSYHPRMETQKEKVINLELGGGAPQSTHWHTPTHTRPSAGALASAEQVFCEPLRNCGLQRPCGEHPCGHRWACTLLSLSPDIPSCFAPALCFPSPCYKGKMEATASKSIQTHISAHLDNVDSQVSCSEFCLLV